MNNWALIYGFWSLHQKNIPLSASSLQTKGIVNWEVNIRNSIFRNPGQWIFYHIPIMPCNLSFPANLGNEDVSSFFLSEDNLHPTGAFDESRFKETPIRTLTEWTPWYWRRRSFPLRMYFFPYFSWPHGRISWFRFHFTLSGISSKVLCLTAAPFLLAWWFPFFKPYP